MLHRNWVLKFSSVIGILLSWYLIAAVAQTPLLPLPTTVFTMMIDEALHGDLLHHLGVTLYRLAVAFSLAMALGVVIGLLMGRSKTVNYFLDTPLILALNMPALVVIMLCYIWFGLSDLSAILAVIINKVPMVVVNVREGVRAIDDRLIQVGKVYRVSRRRMLRHFYLPQLYPYIMASARNGLSLIWKIILVVELLGRSDGIGFALSMYFQFFDITAILAYSFSFIIVIILIENVVMRPIDERIAAWR